MTRKYTRRNKSAPPPNGSQDFTPTVEDLADLAPVPRAKSNGDGTQPWGQPYEVVASDLQVPSQWEPLYRDALLRLERTPSHKVIVYPFDDDRTAERAYSGVSGRFHKHHDAGFAICGIRRNPPRMFVQRGPNWSH